MTMDDKTETKYSIKDGVVCSACGKGGNSHRDKSSGEKTFECPVIGTVCSRRSRERGWVVCRAFVDCCNKVIELSISFIRRETTNDRQGHRQIGR